MTWLSFGLSDFWLINNLNVQWKILRWTNDMDDNSIALQEALEDWSLNSDNDDGSNDLINVTDDDEEYYRGKEKLYV